MFYSAARPDSRYERCSDIEGLPFLLGQEDLFSIGNSFFFLININKHVLGCDGAYCLQNEGSSFGAL